MRIEDAKVAAVFDDCPAELRSEVLALRQLILETAASTEGVGRIHHKDKRLRRR